MTALFRTFDIAMLLWRCGLKNANFFQDTCFCCNMAAKKNLGLTINLYEKEGLTGITWNEYQ